MTYVFTEVLREVSLTPGAKSGLMRGEAIERCLQRRTTMKRATLLALLTASLISMGGARAYAQTVAFKVPFDFTVGSKVLPAETYQVSRPSGNAIQIQSKDGRFHAVTTTFADDKESNGLGNLIFARYGNQYFLRE